jgi:hypothetical protein
MFEKIETLLRQLVKNFDEIPAERKVILQKLSVYLKEKMLANEEINLVYICTHNSRRSHFGQVAAAIAASYFKIKNVHCFSGGTQVTAFNTNAINALEKLGFEINTKESDSKNPMYQVAYSNTQFEKCFSNSIMALGFIVCAIAFIFSMTKNISWIAFSALDSHVLQIASWFFNSRFTTAFTKSSLSLKY